MKNLKAKSILFSLFAMMAVAVFMTSCGQEEVITNEITESNLTELAERLANNANFQATIEIKEKIGNDLTEFMEENGLDLAEDDPVVASFLNSYTVGKDELIEYRTNLLNEIPELKSITLEVSVDVMTTALNTLNAENTIESRGCRSQRDDCIDYWAFLWINGYISSYNYYLSKYYQCLSDYHRCCHYSPEC